MQHLELYALLNPTLYWLDFSIEKPERLPVFKMVWNSLIKILDSLPNKKLDIDIVVISLPILEKVDTFCQHSSPPPEMI